MCMYEWFLFNELLSKNCSWIRVSKSSVFTGYNFVRDTFWPILHFFLCVFEMEFFHYFDVSRNVTSHFSHHSWCYEYKVWIASFFHIVECRKWWKEATHLNVMSVAESFLISLCVYVTQCGKTRNLLSPQK